MNNLEVVIIPVPYEEVVVVEKYFYEYSGLLNLMTQFTSDTNLKPDKERYDEIKEEYLKCFASFNMAYSKLITKYADKYNTTLYKSQLKFDQSSLVFTPVSKCTCDNCK